MRNAAVLVIATMCCTVPLCAQTGVITGMVFDKLGNPATGISVAAWPLDMGVGGGPNTASTNQRGEFELHVIVGYTPDGQLYGGRW